MSAQHGHSWPFTPHGVTWQSERADAATPPDPRWDDFQATQGEWTARLPPEAEGLVTLECDPRNPDAGDVVELALAALGRDGAVVLGNAVAPEVIAKLVEDLQPYIDESPTGDRFLGERTKRIGAVVARSEASYPIVAHPVLMRLCDALVGRQVLRMGPDGVKRIASRPDGVHAAARPERNLEQLPWGLELAQMIQVGGGSPAQPLHYDGGYCLMDFHGICEHKISTIWACNDEDFSEELGATRLVLGSHMWPRDRIAKPEESVPAVMKTGSCVIYLSSTWHGSGQNSTNINRLGLNVDYNCSLIKSEENQFLSNPPSVARHFPTYIQKLVGYTRRGTSQVGSFCDFQHPKDALALASPEGFEGHHRVDWAKPERTADMWLGFKGVDALLVGGEGKIERQLRHSGYGYQHDQVPSHHAPVVDESSDEDICRGTNLEHPAQSIAADSDTSRGSNSGPAFPFNEWRCEAFVPPDPRWCEFQQNLAEHLATLGPPPVRIKWDPTRPRLVEALLAALYRDGCVLLLDAVDKELCAQINEDMQPYIEAAQARHTREVNLAKALPDGFDTEKTTRGESGSEMIRSASKTAASTATHGPTTRVDALPARSDASWPLVAHPALMSVCEAVIGRQVLHMDKVGVAKLLGGRGQQIPWNLNLTQIIQVEPGTEAQLLHRDGGYLQFNFDNQLEHQISTIWVRCCGAAVLLTTCSHESLCEQCVLLICC
eukprot:SAG31_NODE_427_length_15813_cov_13.679649_12_plen_718_part_00